MAAKIILGVAASDAHAVANHLIAHLLRARGYQVVNLGTCTPIAEFVEAHRAHPDAVAALIGSLNGHARDDLAELPAVRAAGELSLPVIVGGNLSVGSEKDGQEAQRLLDLGVDHVLAELSELLPLLERLASGQLAELGLR